MDFDNQILTSRIRDLAKSKNIKLKDMLDHCNLGRNAMSHLDNGRSIAHDSLIRIANYLDVSVDYLLGRTDDPLSHKKSELIELINQLTPEEQQKLITFYHLLKDEHTQSERQ